MGSVTRQFETRASAPQVWSAIRDVGALHTRLVPGFVTDTRMEGETRVVTFGNGMVIREPIIACDEVAMRLVWGAQGGVTTHYNASVQVLPLAQGGCMVRWVADFLPHAVEPAIAGAMQAGSAVMKQTLDRLAAAG